MGNIDFQDYKGFKDNLTIPQTPLLTPSLASSSQMAI